MGEIVANPQSAISADEFRGVTATKQVISYNCALQGERVAGRIRKIANVMELLEENEDAVWCVVARVCGNHKSEPGGRGARLFESGATVYCFPPVRGGAYESVKVVGPDRRTGKLISAVIAASDLEEWRAEAIQDPQVLEQISPPWDASKVSRGVAEGIAAWKAGGPWPTVELRQWNRRHAEKVVGEGTVFKRLRSALARLFKRPEQ